MCKAFYVCHIYGNCYYCVVVLITTSSTSQCPRVDTVSGGVVRLCKLNATLSCSRNRQIALEVYYKDKWFHRLLVIFLGANTYIEYKHCLVK